jgi:hypothetical protein
VSGARHSRYSRRNFLNPGRYRKQASAARAAWRAVDRGVGEAGKAFWNSSQAYAMLPGEGWKAYGIRCVLTVVLRLALVWFMVMVWIPFLLWLVFKLLTY